MGSSYLANIHTHMLRTFLPSNNAAIPCTTCFFPCNNVKVVRNLGFKMYTPSHAYASCVMDHQRKDNNNKGFVMGCASWSLVSELERELEAEILSSEEANEGEGMGRFRHKCGERKGVVELLECLESEAIMGEDVGKEPMDYNRRAQIFDKSSRVFQALKELNHE